MYEFIEVLRAIAAILITNSHFDGVYPINISWGGCPGVALFFTISGFVLATSVKKKNFLKWYFPKIVRIYIPLWIINTITVIANYRSISWKLYLFPIDELWYVPAIMILYILYYVIVNYMKKKTNIIVIVLLEIYAVLYICYYDSAVFFVEPIVYFRFLYGLIAMLIGYKLRIKVNDIKKSNMLLHDFSLSMIFCIGFLIIKLLIPRYEFARQMQFVTQLCGVGFAYYVMRSGMQYESVINKWPRIIKIIFNNISKCSLEIYLVQFLIIDCLKQLVFPLNMVCIIIAIMLSSNIVKMISDCLGKLYKGSKK